MYVITKQQLAESAAKRWGDQYINRYGGTWYVGGRHVGDVHINLVALGPHPTPAEVDAAIGNSSWTLLECDVCEQGVDSAISMSPPYISERHLTVCLPCLIKAQATLLEELMKDDEEDENDG